MTALVAALFFFVSAVPAWAMTVTFVRHAESQANAEGVIDTSVPGPGLSELGRQQAAAIAPTLAANGYDGIYVSSMLRTQQTAQPLLDLLPPGTEYVVLPGVREIPAGIFEGSSEDEGLGRLGYAAAPLAWTLGARFVPIPGGEDGNAFDARVDDALQQIHDNGDENAVVFSHGATIMFWTMMNVDNPDLGLLLSHQLDNTDAVVIEGSPEAGWTLVSWAGESVDPEPSLPTKLFVTVRNLVVAPQTALHDIGTTPAEFTPDTDTTNETVDGAVTRNVQTVATSSTKKASNGATDLTDGNKAEPGKPGKGARSQSGGGLEVVAETSAPAATGTTKTDAGNGAPGTATAGANETGGAGSKPDAA
jgi:broad specificity phosphatase PhoE